VGLVIIIFPAVLRPLLDQIFPGFNLVTGAPASPYAYLTSVLTHGFASMVVLAVPMILSLTWNKWAGGVAGFLMGTLYYLAYAGYNIQYSMQFAADMYKASGYDPAVFMQYLPPNLYADPSFIGNWIVGGMLIGYITGALSNGSVDFKRMLGAALTASIIVAMIQFALNVTVAFSASMVQNNLWFAFFIVMLPGVLLGIIAPIIAKVMTWYGLQPMRH
jgi:hypothetical protein